MPNEALAFKGRLRGVVPNPAAAHRQHIVMHQAGIEQFPNDVTGAACRLKLVHISAAIGIHMRQSGHHV